MRMLTSYDPSVIKSGKSVCMQSWLEKSRYIEKRCIWKDETSEDKVSSLEERGGMDAHFWNESTRKWGDARENI